MAIPDPKPNGEPAAKSDEFEMTLEPVDPAELNFDDAPMVEALSPPRPGFGFWKAFLWCIAFLLVTQGVPAVCLVIGLVTFEGPAIVRAARERADQAGAANGNEKSMEDRVTDELLNSPQVRKYLQVAVVATPIWGLAFTLFLLPRVAGRNWSRRIALRAPHLEHVVLVVLLAFPFMVFNIALESLLSRTALGGDNGGFSDLRKVMQSMTTWPGWVLVLGICVGPAISEEMFCRGFLGQGLGARYGLMGAILATSFLFGFIHLQPLQGLAAALMGIVLHLIYVASRSIWIPIALHFLNNLLAILAESERLPLLIGKSLEQAYEYRPVLMLASAGLMVVVIGWAFSVSRVRIWSANRNEMPDSRYRHVALPPEFSALRAIKGPIPAATAVALIAATGFFTAMWFGM